MRGYLLLSLLCLVLLTGCASAPRSAVDPAAGIPQADVSVTQTRSPAHDDVLFHAFSLVGTPYKYGGSSPSTGFDCSGLINYVFREAAGVQLPRTTAGLSAMQAHEPSPRSLQPGDLLLFAMGGRQVDHAGIYVGDGRFLHAPSSGGRVRVDNLQASHWQRSFKGARRVLD